MKHTLCTKFVKRVLFLSILFTFFFVVPAKAFPESGETALYQGKNDLFAAENASKAKNGLKKENGHFYYYVNGEKVKKQWVTIGQNKYYFDQKGCAATGSKNINGKIYVFRATGRLVHPEKTRFVTVAGNKYYVNTKGQAYTGNVKIGGKIYLFRSNGRLVQPAKSRFLTEAGNVYYVNVKGQASTGNVKIGNVIYVFRANGRLVRPAKTSFVKVANKWYYVNTKGQASTGWLVVNNGLYYANTSGVLWTNKTYEGIVFDSTGKAKDNVSARLKILTMEIVSSITDSGMTSDQKLLACWNYMVNRSRFVYWPKYPDLNKTGWQKETALDMLTTKQGNCYSFACAFAALTAEAGFDPEVICGRVSGTRDGAADGMSRHAWVKINGRYYDPEGKFAGWANIYGTYGFTVNHVIQKIVNFRRSV